MAVPGSFFFKKKKQQQLEDLETVPVAQLAVLCSLGTASGTLGYLVRGRLDVLVVLSAQPSVPLFAL